MKTSLFISIFIYLFAFSTYAQTFQAEDGIRSHIVETALQHIGRSDQDDNCPKEGCYLAYGKNWCSEFVSYVFHQAGVPFTNGNKKDWRLPNTRKIRRWYRKNGTFISYKDQGWEDFTPKPGDYVFIGRAKDSGKLSGWKHSGIVESIDEHGTLYTIEGNNGERPVNRYHYLDYKNNRTDNGAANAVVLGFGRRHLVTKDKIEDPPSHN